jgi:hypothetical protein
MGSSLSIIHSSNGQMASSGRCYCDRVRLPVTQSSNGRDDVGGRCYWEFQSSHQNRDAHRYLIGLTCQSPKVATGMNHRPIATVNFKHRTPLSRYLFEYATDNSYKCQSVVRSLSSNQSLSRSLNSLFSKEWHPTTITASTSWRRLSHRW